MLILDRKVIQTLRAAENIKDLCYVACNPQLAMHNLVEYVFVFVLLFFTGKIHLFR